MKPISYSSLFIGLIIGSIISSIFALQGSNNSSTPIYDSRSTTSSEEFNERQLLVNTSQAITIEKNIEPLDNNLLISLIEKIVAKRIEKDLSPKLDKILASLKQSNRNFSLPKQILPTKLQLSSFSKAFQVVDQAIQNGTFDQSTQLILTEESNLLTTEQNFQLQKKLSAAVNDGSIVLSDNVLLLGLN